jgi:hypothetical protein
MPRDDGESGHASVARLEAITPHTEAKKAMFSLMSMAGLRRAVFWFCTLIVAQELFAGSMWALLRIPFDKEQLAHLGYPLYLLSILGTWKLGAGAVIARALSAPQGMGIRWGVIRFFRGSRVPCLRG